MVLLHLAPKINSTKEIVGFTTRVIIMDYPGQIRSGYVPVLGCNSIYHSHPQSTIPNVISIASSSIPIKPTSLTTSSTNSTSKPDSLNTSFTHVFIHFPISFFSHSFPYACMTTLDTSFSKPISFNSSLIPFYSSSMRKQLLHCKTLLDGPHAIIHLYLTLYLISLSHFSFLYLHDTHNIF